MAKPLHFTSSGLPGMRFVRRPVTQPPAIGGLFLVDDGHELGWHRRPVAARYQDGAWTTEKGRPLAFQPTFWTAIEGPHDGL